MANSFRVLELGDSIVWGQGLRQGAVQFSKQILAALH